MSRLPVAIASAMHDELRALLPLLRDRLSVRLAGRDFHQGTIHGQPVVLVLSGIGKVAATTTAVLLMHEFNARELVFTGVAGGLRDDVKVGDVVVAQQLLQHDMDASPLFPRFEIPLTGRSRFEADAQLGDALAAAAQRCLARADALLSQCGSATLLNPKGHEGAPRGPGGRAPQGGVLGALIGAAHVGDFGIDAARVHRGLIISGDRFVCSAEASAALRALLPDALAVEMEGAAVAQACADFGRPFAVLRTISDRADADAHVAFTRFVDEVASVYTRVIVEDWLQHRSKA